MELLMPRDLFDLDGGDFTDDYTATTTNLLFQAGNYGWQAVFTNKLDEPTPKNDGTLRTEAPAFYGLPPGWTSPDGVRLVHESADPDKRVNANSQFGKVIARAKETGAAEAIGDPYDANSWVGLRWHWMTEGAGVDYDFKDKDSGERKTGKSKGRVMPVEFLGTTANPLVGNTGDPHTNGFGDLDPESFDLPDDVLGALRDLAPTLTYGKFVSEGMHFKDAEGCGSLVGALGNKAFYTALGGVEA